VSQGKTNQKSYEPTKKNTGVTVTSAQAISKQERQKKGGKICHGRREEFVFLQEAGWVLVAPGLGCGGERKSNSLTAAAIPSRRGVIFTKGGKSDRFCLLFFKKRGGRRGGWSGAYGPLVWYVGFKGRYQETVKKWGKKLAEPAGV